MIERADRLWVPLISHYREDAGSIRLNVPRIEAQIAAIRPFVSQYLLAGSTGDGWEMNDAMLAEMAGLVVRPAFAGSSILIGALGRSTSEVIRRAQLVEEVVRKARGAGGLKGLAICPPIDAKADQDAILGHYEAVLAATSGPIAIYELPQVTMCSIASPTLRILSANPRITMFKDTSGADKLIAAGVSGVISVRGAEGNYFEAVTQQGYDGLLLSTANGFARPLRRMLDQLASGQKEDAAAISTLLTAVITAIFDVASSLSFGNAFSNANRAVDHLRAYGSEWRSAPAPLTFSGSVIPRSLLEQVSDRLLSLVETDQGYLQAK